MMRVISTGAALEQVMVIFSLPLIDWLIGAVSG